MKHLSWIERGIAIFGLWIIAYCIATLCGMKTAGADTPGDCFGSVTCKEFEEFKVCENRQISCWFRLDGTLIACAARPIKNSETVSE